MTQRPFKIRLQITRRPSGVDIRFAYPWVRSRLVSRGRGQ